MATTAPHELYGVYALIGPHLKTDKIGGVVGDAKHGSGYHLSLDALRARGLEGSDYSTICPADKRGKRNQAAGLDITFGSLSELITVHTRLKVACEKHDPRTAPIREIIGTLDGRNVSGYNRVATGSGSRSRVGWTASGFSDKSHLWHEHISCLRDTVNDANAMAGIAELVCGLPAGALGWKSPGEVAVPSTTPASGSKPAPAPKPVEVKVSLSALVKAFKADPARPQGGTTSGSVDDVKAVEWALFKEGVLPKEFAEDASAGSSTGVAYQKWQRELGFTGKDADGIPGRASLVALGAKYGFKVVA